MGINIASAKTIDADTAGEKTMGGYAGKTLRINLTDGRITTEPLDRDSARKYLSGRGLAGKMFVDEVPGNVDPFSADNKIYIGTGVLTGTSAPASARFTVATKTPVNGAVSSSNSGGYWGVQLKFAGYDMVVLEGKAPSPVYIGINGDVVEIRDAARFWGLDTHETVEAVKRDFGDPMARVLAIGPAGENRALMAAFINDIGRVAGRGGVGAVFGSKNVKALVVRGTGRVETARPTEMKAVLAAALGRFKEAGISETTSQEKEISDQEIKKFESEEEMSDQDDKIQGEEEILREESASSDGTGRNDACYRCPIVCGRHKKEKDKRVRLEGKTGNGGENRRAEKDAAGKQMKKSSFHSDCRIEDQEVIQAANDLCDKLGLDLVSVGVTIATGMALAEQGCIQPQELDGIPLAFGDGRRLLEWIRKIAYREGFGAKLSLGSYYLTEIYGQPDLAMTLKKLEVPAYDRKEFRGQELEIATGNKGGGHVREHVVAPEALGLPPDFDLNLLENKALWVQTLQDLTAVVDSLGLCLFTSAALNLENYTALLNAAAGSDYTTAELLACGERIWNLERLQFVWQELPEWDEILEIIGENMADDEDVMDYVQPEQMEKLLRVEIPAGLAENGGHTLKELLKAYYRKRGWDDRGIPTMGRMQALGIMNARSAALWGNEPDEDG